MLRAAYILLGEDSEADTYFARRCFAAAGIKVGLRRCSTGAEVCADLTRCNGDLPLAVLLDLKMPLMDGFETLKWIRDNPAYAHLPVVILSSSNLDEDRLRAARLGCTEYLVKPSSLPNFEKLLKNLVDRLVTNHAIAQLTADPHGEPQGKGRRPH